MLIHTTFHFLSQEDGEFLGAAELYDHAAELWSENGDVDTHINVTGLYGDELYSVLVNQFATDMGLDDSDVYLTPENESEILYAS